MKTLSVYDSIRYRIIGSRYGSVAIQQEIQTVIARWKEFIDVMTTFGFGPDELAEASALAEAHLAAINLRSQSVVQKGLSLDARNAAINAGWTWYAQATGMMFRLSRTDAEVARSLNEARADEDTELVNSITMLKLVLQSKGSLLSPAIPVAARIAEADDLITRLQTVFGDAANAKGKPMEDTAEIDELDGKLYVIIRDFNKAGRAAVRAGLLPDRAPYFRFNHIGAGVYRRKATEDGPETDPTSPEDDGPMPEL